MMERILTRERTVCLLIQCGRSRQTLRWKKSYAANRLINPVNLIATIRLRPSDQINKKLNLILLFG